MLVVLANELPPAIRGRLKLWFIEPRPNVFISGINDAAASYVVEYLYKYCSSEAGLLLIRSLNRPPWFEVRTIGSPRKPIMDISGLQLVVETLRSKPSADVSDE